MVENTGNDPPEEVFLTFNYQNLFNRVVVALYEDGQFYLPVSELFTSLKIPHDVSLNPPLIEGSYLHTSNSFKFNFKTYSVELDTKGTVPFNASDMRIRELDYYVTPEVLQKVFDLNFSVDFNNLLLKLESPYQMPVAAEYERAKNREKQKRFSFQQDYYPLRYDRNRKLLAGGFLDYSLTSNITESENLYTYNLNLGTEILGGDLQGTGYGSVSQNTTNFITDNFRWRYVWRNQNKISQFFIGQTSTDGLIGRSFVGLRATNEPIEPRYIYDEFEIEGEALPGSEVELYFNDALYDYQEITGNGRYRFLAPLTYGSSRLSLKIYDPAGGVRERTQRIQVPFNFLPSGELNYHINAGRLDRPVFGSTREGNILQGDMAYGISNWLTQKIGVEYLDEFTGQTPFIYGSTSARLFNQYLLNVDVAPSIFYRFSSGAIYSSSASWNLDYTYYTDNGIYNILGSDHELKGNIFVPFTLFNLPFNVRLLGNHSISPSFTRTRYSVDLNTRFSRLNLRLRYSDNQTGSFTFDPSIGSEINTSATYFVSRNSSIPSFLQGLFLRGELSYNPNLSELIQTDVQASKSIFGSGRIQATFSRNYRGDFNLFSLGLTIDLNSTRTTSTIRNFRNGVSFSQNLLGSVGFDDNNQRFLFSNRQQVGRSATSVRLYIDNNNSGVYDQGDDVIKNNAVRIGRSGVTSTGGNGIIYLSQLQPYNQVNLQINRSAIENPMLVPELENFSIVTDPNQYKPLNIPFYRSGVVSGKVTRIKGTAREPMPGLRVYLSNEKQAFLKEMRTFNDGSFYAYEIPPGTYKLYIDKRQLDFLNAVSRPDTVEITVDALAEGDFIEDIGFSIYPGGTQATEEPITEKQLPSQETAPPSAKAEQGELFEVQLASFKFPYNAFKARKLAQKSFSEKFVIKYNPKRRLYAVRSLPITKREEAIEKVFSAEKELFENPALVVVDDSISADTVSVGNIFIQLGAFKKRSNAERFSRLSNAELSVPIEFYFDEADSYYKVRSRSFASQDRAEELLGQIRQKPEFQGAYLRAEGMQTGFKGMDFDYLVRVQDIPSPDSKRSYYYRIQEVTSSAKELDTDETPDVIIFDNIPTWEEAIKLKKELANVEGSGRIILVLLEYIR